MVRRSVDISNNTAAFRVFADSTPKPAKTQPLSKASMLGQKNSTHGCAVLQELNLNKSKPFTLSPNSQICSEKENFDPVKKYIVAYKRSKSHVPPLGERTSNQQIRQAGAQEIARTQHPVSSIDARPALNRTRDNQPRANAPTAECQQQRLPSLRKTRTYVDNLTHLLSDIDIVDSMDTPSRLQNTHGTNNRPPKQQPYRELPPPVLRLGRHVTSRVVDASSKSNDTSGSKARSSRLQSRSSLKRNATMPEKRSREPRQHISAVFSPPDLKHNIR